MTAPVVGPDRVSQVDRGNMIEYWSEAGTVHGPLPREDMLPYTERDQVSIADPVPLGWAAFAAAASPIGAYYAWFVGSSIFIAIPIALMFGGIAQFLAGMWAFRRGNVLMATVFTTLSGYFGTWAVMLWLITAGVLPTPTILTDTTYMVGIVIIMFGIITGYLGIAAMAQNKMNAWILFTVTLALFGQGTGYWTHLPSAFNDHNWISVIGGYALMLAALLAFYESAAIVINSARGYESVPTFRIRKTVAMLPNPPRSDAEVKAEHTHTA